MTIALQPDMGHAGRARETILEVIAGGIRTRPTVGDSGGGEGLNEVPTDARARAAYDMDADLAPIPDIRGRHGVVVRPLTNSHALVELTVLPPCCHPVHETILRPS